MSGYRYNVDDIRLMNEEIDSLTARNAKLVAAFKEIAEMMKPLDQVLAEMIPEHREAVLKRYHDLINNPPEPTEALKKMVRKYGRVNQQSTEKL